MDIDLDEGSKKSKRRGVEEHEEEEDKYDGGTSGYRPKYLIHCNTL